MLKKFLSNCKKPTGKFGKMIVSAMNKGHAPLALWAFEVCPLKDGESVLDVGCGGGGGRPPGVPDWWSLRNTGCRRRIPFWTSAAAVAAILSAFWSAARKAARTASIIRRKALHAAGKRPKNMRTGAVFCAETP